MKKQKTIFGTDTLPTISIPFLNKQVMCGLCNFGCEKVKTFHAEFTNDEIKKIKEKYGIVVKPIIVFGDKGCPCLRSDGCVLGNDKPKFCKLYPLFVSAKNKLCLANWAMLHCPQPKDYKLKEITFDSKYHYVCLKNEKNYRKELVLDYDINTFPPLIIFFKEFLIDNFGKEWYDGALKQWKNSK